MTQKQILYTFKSKLHCQILKISHSFGLVLHQNRFGPKIFTDYQRFALIVLFLRSGKALREFVETLPESRWTSWLGLREIPSKSSLHAWMRQYTTAYPRLLNEMLLKDEKPSLMAIDATGVDSWQRSRHYERRIGETPMPYAKLDLLVDTKKFLIHDHVLRIKPRHDTLGARTMFQRLKLKNMLVLADRGYDSESLHQVAEQQKITLYAPVRNYHVKKPHGKHRRRCSKGNIQYSRRNCVESLIHSFKTTRVNHLRSKKAYMKKREIAWQILTYNLIKLSKALQALLHISQPA